MRFPSLADMTVRAGETLRRFPEPLVVALLSTIMGLAGLWSGSYPTTFPYWTENDYVLNTACGVILFTMILSLVLVRESGRISRRTEGLSYLVAIGLVMAIRASIDLSRSGRIIILVFLALAHLQVALCGMLHTGRTGFWAYNKALFLRICSGALFTGVLTIGLELAVVAGEVLFDMHIDNEIYPSIFIVMFGIVHTWFFLAGIPAAPARDKATIEVREVPRGLRIFSQFVLLPLVVVFSAILYAYVVKVLFVSGMHGSVSAFILLLTGCGVLAWLFTAPLHGSPEYRWVRSYVRILGILLIPLTVVLWVAVLQRIGDYGMTEPRYVVMALAACCTVIAPYLAFVRNPDIRIVPLSLFVAGLVTVAGPIGARAVSWNDQTSRAEAVLREHAMTNGRFDRNKALAMPDSLKRIVANTVDYVYDYSDTTRITSWFSDIGVPSMSDTTLSYSHGDLYAYRLGVITGERHPRSRYESVILEAGTMALARVPDGSAIPFIFDFDAEAEVRDTVQVGIGNDRYVLYLASHRIAVRRQGSEDVALVDVGPLMDSHGIHQGEVPLSSLAAEGKASTFSVTMLFTRVTASRAMRDSTLASMSGSGVIYIRQK